jgi:hypothetical protein
LGRVRVRVRVRVRNVRPQLRENKDAVAIILAIRKISPEDWDLRRASFIVASCSLASCVKCI